MMKFFESPRPNVQYVCVHLEQSQSLCSPVVMLFMKSAVFNWRNSLIPLRAQCAGKAIPLLTRWPVRKGCKPIIIHSPFHRWRNRRRGERKSVGVIIGAQFQIGSLAVIDQKTHENNFYFSRFKIYFFILKKLTYWTRRKYLNWTWFNFRKRKNGNQTS